MNKLAEKTLDMVLPAAHSAQVPAKPEAPTALVVQTDATSIMAVISRAASDPATDVDKLERLLGMYERIRANEARAAYMAALAKLQPDLPVISRKGKIEIRKKDTAGERTGAVQQATPYALWEDINEAITPKLSQNGFALSFRTGSAVDGKITVTGILSHAAGHQEETTITLMHDSTGSKNRVQAVGSSISYGKRYTAMLLLNITTRGEDDDGKAAGIGDTISDEQVSDLRQRIMDTDTDLPAFLDHFKIEKLEEMPGNAFARAVKMLEMKAARAKK